MRPKLLIVASVVAICGCMQLCLSARVPLSITAADQLGEVPAFDSTAAVAPSKDSSGGSGGQSTFECGKPYGPCGTAVPGDALCEAGPGWCVPGYYCAAENNTAPSKCLPIPADCGIAGNPCCPSNTDAPHNASIQKIDKKPFCRDGSTCFYDPTAPLLTLDIYAGIPGWLGCVAVPETCGIGPNTSCCPDLYQVATNPLLPRSGCPDNTYCDHSPLAATFPGASLLLKRPGTCVNNAPGCGQVGKPCCISNSGPTVGLRCVPEGGQRGYCADMQGLTLAQGAKETDLLCILCPAALGEDLRITDPDTFFRCGGATRRRRVQVQAG